MEATTACNTVLEMSTKSPMDEFNHIKDLTIPDFPYESHLFDETLNSLRSPEGLKRMWATTSPKNVIFSPRNAILGPVPVSPPTEEEKKSPELKPGIAIPNIDWKACMAPPELDDAPHWLDRLDPSLREDSSVRALSSPPARRRNGSRKGVGVLFGMNSDSLPEKKAFSKGPFTGRDSRCQVPRESQRQSQRQLLFSNSNTQANTPSPTHRTASPKRKALTYPQNPQEKRSRSPSANSCMSQQESPVGSPTRTPEYDQPVSSKRISALEGSCRRPQSRPSSRPSSRESCKSLNRMMNTMGFEGSSRAAGIEGSSRAPKGRRISMLTSALKSPELNYRRTRSQTIEGKSTMPTAMALTTACLSSKSEQSSNGSAIKAAILDVDSAIILRQGKPDADGMVWKPASTSTNHLGFLSQHGFPASYLKAEERNNLRGRQRARKPRRAARRFTCLYCGKIFKERSNVVAHIRVHTGEKPYKCGECGWSFAQKSNLKRHVRSHHG
mmetsp:Transcript_5303/g.10546  ORF Transcript_5303/g.10546 Transcript_5303/m.10546 type:complete len:498 (-) Transcript_5303:319-1812(-)